MARDNVLRAIKDAEIKATETLSEAKKEATTIISQARQKASEIIIAVSYTHLTLPTIYAV